MNQHSVHALPSVKFSCPKARHAREAVLLPALAATTNASLRRSQKELVKATSTNSALAITSSARVNTAAPSPLTQTASCNSIVDLSNDNKSGRDTYPISSYDILRNTPANHRRQRAHAARDDDAEVKSRRQKYTHLLCQLMRRMDCHNSLTVFIETIIGELSMNTANPSSERRGREFYLDSNEEEDNVGVEGDDERESRVPRCDSCHRCGGDMARAYTSPKDELESSEVSVVTRAAAGTWALHLLAEDMSSSTLHRILEALLPAIYVGYRAHNLDFASPSIQAQIQSPKTIRMNPYLTHPMHMEQVTLCSITIRDLNTRLDRALRANERRRTFVFRIIQLRRRQRLYNVLHAWRMHVRRIRILSFTAAGRVRRHTEESSFFRLKMTLARWKLGVEVERNDFLTGRLQDAASQLDSVKNQFQLQCYRAERLIENDRKMQEKLRDANRVKGMLEERVRQLELEVQQRDEMYRLQLESNTRRSFQLVEHYQKAIMLLMQSRVLMQTCAGHQLNDIFSTESTPRNSVTHPNQQRDLEQQDENDEDEEDDSEFRGGECANSSRSCASSYTNSNPLANMLRRIRRISNCADGTLLKELSVALKSPGASVECVGAGQQCQYSRNTRAGLPVSSCDTRNSAEDHLMRASDATMSLLWWCNHVLREVQPHKHTKDIRNFGKSFCNGELYWVLLVYVFPSAAHEPPAALRPGALDFGLQYKLSQLRDVASRYLQCVVEPSDFINQSEDKIVRSLGEMYVCHVTHRWRACATDGFASVVQFVDHCTRQNKRPADCVGQKNNSTKLVHTDSMVTDNNASIGHDRTPMLVGDQTVRAVGETGVQEDDCSTNDDDLLFDNETVQRRLKEYEERFDELKKTMLEQSCAEALVTHTCALTKERSVYLTQEAYSGVPMHYISPSSTRPFYAVSERVISDVEEKAARASVRYRGKAGVKKIASHSKHAPLSHRSGPDGRGGHLVSGAADRRRHMLAADDANHEDVEEVPISVAIPHVLHKHVDTVSRLYYYYSGNRADTMMEIHFWHFVWSTRFIMDEMKQGDIAEIFDRVASPNLYSAMLTRVQGKSEGEVNAMLAAARQEMDVRSIGATQFAEALVRMAVKRYCNGDSSSDRPLPDLIDNFLSRLRVPQTTELAPVLVSLYDTHSQAVVRFFCNDLARIFFFYVRQGMTSSYAHRRVLETNGYGRFCAQLTLKMYTTMLQDCRYVPPSAASGKKNLRAKVSDDTTMGQKEGVVDTTSRSDSANTEHSCNSASDSANLVKQSVSDKGIAQCLPASECVATNDKATAATVYRDTRLPCMTLDQVKRMIDTLNINYNVSTTTSGISFAVFVEGFAVLSNYWCPDPFVPAPRKLAALIANTMSTLGERHRKSTLILSCAPTISLNGPACINFDREAI